MEQGRMSKSTILKFKCDICAHEVMQEEGDLSKRHNWGPPDGWVTFLEHDEQRERDICSECVLLITAVIA